MPSLPSIRTLIPVAASNRWRLYLAYGLLALGLLLLGGSMGFKRWYFRGGLKSIEYREVQRLAHQIEQELPPADAQADTMAATLLKRKEAGFPTFSGLSRYDAFIYRDTALTFWSTSEYVLARKDTAARPGWSLELNPDGAFLVRTTPVQDTTGRYTVYTVIALHRRFTVRNFFLRPYYLFDGLKETRIVSTERGRGQPHAIPVLDTEGKPILYLEPSESPEFVQLRANRLLILSLSAGFLLAFAGLWMLANVLVRGQKTLSGIGLWIGSSLALRLLALSLSFPQEFTDWEIFSPRLYATSQWAPNLGDLFIDVLLCGSWFFFLFRHFFSTRLYIALKDRLLRRPWLLSGLASLYSLSLVLGCYALIRDLYEHTQTVPDITQGFDFSPAWLLTLGLIVAAGFGLFFACHLPMRLLVKLKRIPGSHIWVGWGIGCGLLVVLAVFWPVFFDGEKAPWGLVLLLIASFSGMILQNLPEYLFKLRYQTYFYLFGFAIVCAAMGMEGYRLYRQRHLALEKERWARRVVSQGDPLGEYLLAEMQRNIQADSLIRKAITDTAVNTSLAEARIRRYYTDNYFDQYSLEIGIYDKFGTLVGGTAEALRYSEMTRLSSLQLGKTSAPGLYYGHMPSDEILKRYIALIDLRDSSARGSETAGHVVLDLKLRRLPDLSIFPALLVDGPNISFSNQENFSFAAYDSTYRLSVQEGVFNYERKLDSTFLRKAPDEATLSMAGWEHTVFRLGDGQTVVVSAPDTAWRDAFANFSFLLLILVLFVLAFIVAFTIQQQVSVKGITFAGKIQIYLNGAFFLPLTVFGLVTFILVDVSLESDLNAGYLQRARAAAKAITPILDRYASGKLNKDALNQRLDQMARFSGLDASVYSAQGRVLYSSHPLIFRKRILSGFLNPKALSQLADGGLPEVLLQEHVGKLQYSSAFVAIRAPGTRRITAILAVPFFESGAELERQLSNAVATVVNSFTAVFIAFMMLSYFASRLLVVPLKLITSRLRRTTFGDNEPLAWDAKDEIGLLVDEYNRMLQKLDASREALRATEKESAWRQMAQQVAHEIKNPLTPMKLSIQMLQRQAETGQIADADQLKRKLANLLEQIDNLSEIASSFSAFAKMPIPRSEAYDVVAALRPIVDLHRSSGRADVRLETDQPGVIVMGDEGLMQGVFTNLILNGIQSVAPGQWPAILVRVWVSKGFVTLSFTDNGTGIPAEVQPHIFKPNFSTKYTGSGIGLALAKRMVDSAGGTIRFETSEGQGTVFYIELPVVG